MATPSKTFFGLNSDRIISSADWRDIRCAAKVAAWVIGVLSLAGAVVFVPWLRVAVAALVVAVIFLYGAYHILFSD